MFKQIRNIAHKIINRLKPRAETKEPRLLPVIDDTSSQTIEDFSAGVAPTETKSQEELKLEKKRENTPVLMLPAQPLMLAPSSETTAERACEKIEPPHKKPQETNNKITPESFQVAAHLVDKTISSKIGGPQQPKVGSNRRHPSFDRFPVKHPKANYYDETGKLVEANYRDLEDQDFLRYAYSYNISFFDDMGRRLQIRLYENGIRRPHFWLVPEAMGSSRIVTFDNAVAYRETNRIHEARIEYLLGAFSRTCPSSVYTIDWMKGYGAKGKKYDELDVERFVLGDIGGYDWKKNTEQFSLSLGNVRPDIIGTPQTIPSEQHPSIIIEVINSHYPSEATWAAYVQHTIERPLLILFDFTEKKNYFLQVVPADERKQILQPTIRTVYFLWKGFLWQNTTPLPQGIFSQNFKRLVDLNVRNLNRRSTRSAQANRTGQPPGAIFGS